MSELISGEEAKIAWAEGVDVQVATGPDKFRTLVSSDDLGIFDCGNYFRIKHRTTNLNGIEVPSPLEPKDGDVVWVISDYRNGYREVQYNKSIYNDFGAWRTEEEIKQVVAALRSVFGKK